MSNKSFKYIVTVFLVFLISFTPFRALASDASGSAVTVITPKIAASTAVVIDGETGAVLFDKGKDVKMYPASITKILTALMIIEMFSSEDEIVFTETAIKRLEHNSSNIGARLDEIMTIDQALHGLMLMSANEVALALAEAHSGSNEAFAEEMSDRAATIGASNSHFLNPHGLHDADHYSTAYDMALITREAIKYDYFLEIMSHSTYNIDPTNKCDEIRYLAQKHKMLNDKKDMRIYREDVIAGKSGYTTESGHTLVTVADNGDRTVIVVILRSDAANVYEDTRKLIEYGYAVPVPEVDVKQAQPDEVDNVEAASATYDSINEADSSITEPMVNSVDEGIASAGIDANEKASKGGFLIKVLLFVGLGIAFVMAVLVADQKRSRRRRAERAQRLRR